MIGARSSANDFAVFRLALDAGRGLAALDCMVVGAGQRVVRLDEDHDPEPALEVTQVHALLVQYIKRHEACAFAR